MTSLPLPDACYRVSVKALVQNNEGKILLAKEKRGVWNIPGGGIEHGESTHEALKRELFEEVGLKEKFEEKIISTNSFFVKHRNTWLFWIICSISANKNMSFSAGIDTNEIRFFSKSEVLDLEEGTYEPNVLNMFELI